MSRLYAYVVQIKLPARASRQPSTVAQTKAIETEIEKHLDRHCLRVHLKSNVDHMFIQ